MNHHSRLTLLALLTSVLLAACQAPTDFQTASSRAQSSQPLVTTARQPSRQATLSQASIDQLLNLALDCVHKEYPNVLLHHLSSEADAQPPSQLHPAFYGCFDWHSAVHGHWLLARLAHLFPDSEAAPAAREALFVSLGKEHIAAETTYLQAPGRAGFERPYGLAWLLQLDAELGDWATSGDALADELQQNLAPLVRQAVAHFQQWLPKLSHPVRSGTHAQTAFALGLARDWAQTRQRESLVVFLDEQARRLYAADQSCPLHYEPSGHDFLSACLAEADLMRRLMPTAEFSNWLDQFLPSIAQSSAATWLPPAQVTDPSDGHLAHLDGLNLSRAWMLQGIAHALGEHDPRSVRLLQTARQHQLAGMASIEDPHYAGGHWLGSFATYLVTQRGITKQ